MKKRKKEKRLEEEYKPWVLKHEKYPSQTSDDEIEKSLGQWRNRCRLEKFKPLLDFDKEVNFSSRKSRESPEERLKEYKFWSLEHKKYPNSHSDDEIEKSLGRWRSVQRKKKFKPLLDFDKEVNFGSPKSPEKRFEEEYKPWVLEHKKYPNPKSDDEIERSLGAWRCNNRIKKFKPLLVFDEKVNFRSCKSPKERFMKEYVPWALKHRKYPSQHSDDEIERSLGVWRKYANRIKNFEQLKNFDIFYSNYLIGNRIAIEIFNELKKKGVI